MYCQGCDNKDRQDIVPKRYGSAEKNLCIPCYNEHAFQWGEPYLCSKCSMTQLRMASLLTCHSCAGTDKINKIIKKRRPLAKADYRSRSLRYQCQEQMKNKIYNENYKHLSNYYKLTDEDCPIMMCDIPEDLVKFCMNGSHTYDEIAAEAEQYDQKSISPRAVFL